MGDESVGRVPLAGAIAALRQELLEAWTDAANQQLRFKITPVELTLQVLVTSTSTGRAGIKWWLIDAGAETSRERSTTQTIKLTLDPVTLDAHGNTVSVFIAGLDDSAETGLSQDGRGSLPLAADDD